MTSRSTPGAEMCIRDRFTTVENEVTFSHAEVEQARQMLAKAQKPMLYVGGGAVSYTHLDVYKRQAL